MLTLNRLNPGNWFSCKGFSCCIGLTKAGPWPMKADGPATVWGIGGGMFWNIVGLIPKLLKGWLIENPKPLWGQMGLVGRPRIKFEYEDKD